MTLGRRRFPPVSNGANRLHRRRATKSIVNAIRTDQWTWTLDWKIRQLLSKQQTFDSYFKARYWPFPNMYKPVFRRQINFGHWKAMFGEINTWHTMGLWAWWHLSCGVCGCGVSLRTAQRGAEPPSPVQVPSSYKKKVGPDTNSPSRCRVSPFMFVHCERAKWYVLWGNRPS